MYQQTSRMAYDEVKKDGLGQRQEQVLDQFKYVESVCNGELARSLNMGINQITPRVSELREKGLVEEDHRGKDPATGRTVIYWRIRKTPPSFTQQELF